MNRLQYLVATSNQQMSNRFFQKTILLKRATLTGCSFSFNKNLLSFLCYRGVLEFFFNKLHLRNMSLSMQR